MEKVEIYRILNQAYFSEQRHEREILDNLSALLNGVRIFVDVGASLGQYTFFANQCLKNAEIYAFEPDPIRFEQLKRNCEMWEAQNQNRLVPVQGAVGKEPGEVIFYTTHSNVSGGLFEHPVPTDVEWQQITVRCYALDFFFSKRDPDLIKVDVEGSELHLLQGAKRILKSGHAKFLIEIHNWLDSDGHGGESEVLQLMQSEGYSFQIFHGSKLFKKSALRRLFSHLGL